MTAEYETIKVLRSTKDELDRFKRDNDLPSLSQAVTVLVERQKGRQQVMDEMSNKIAEEGSKIIAKLFYELAFDIAKNTNKPITSITLDDMVEAMKKSR